MTERQGCIAATVAIWSFLIAVAFVLAAILRDPAWTDGQRLHWWGCYSVIALGSAVATVVEWRRR